MVLAAPQEAGKIPVAIAIAIAQPVPGAGAGAGAGRRPTPPITVKVTWRPPPRQVRWVGSF
jgi:hypothetical protein